eukprot:m.421073 g.421073  ORF g.421073 m.421073 type:complete len:313 (+) comp33380_c0_seq1:313-1251(+)
MHAEIIFTPMCRRRTASRMGASSLTDRLAVPVGALAVVALIWGLSMASPMSSRTAPQRRAQPRWQTRANVGIRKKGAGAVGYANAAITVAISSCRRHDLLLDTIATFEALNTAPIRARLILDCDNDTKAYAVARSVHPGYTAVPSATFTTREQNIMDNMQALFSAVQTRFIYFSEGDWNTTRGGFIDEAMGILNGNSTTVSQVVGVRRFYNNDKVYGVATDKTFFKKQDFVWHHANCPAGVSGVYGSWSNNPSLVDMRVFRANIRTFSRFKDEPLIRKAFRTPEGKCLKMIAQLDVDCVVHTGGGRHVVHRR